MKVVSSQRGFTLIELIISMGILMILISILTTLFGQIIDVQLESKAISSVDQNGRYVMARLTHDMQSAQSIILPATPGQVTDSLQLSVNSINYTYSLISNNLILTNDNGTDVLNTDTVGISALTFKRIGSGDSNDTVQVSFTVSTKTQQAHGIESKQFQTTLGLQ